MCATWADDYDWRATERRLNAIGQFRTELDGLGIHFLHARSPHADALPLVMTHGWPGSVIEFLGVHRPADAARRPRRRLPRRLPVAARLRLQRQAGASPGWGVERIAAAWATLMARLGYERYGAQGSDWGTTVTDRARPSTTPTTSPASTSCRRS